MTSQHDQRVTGYADIAQAYTPGEQTNTMPQFIHRAAIQSCSQSVILQLKFALHIKKQ